MANLGVNTNKEQKRKKKASCILNISKSFKGINNQENRLRKDSSFFWCFEKTEGGRGGLKGKKKTLFSLAHTWTDSGQSCCWNLAKFRRRRHQLQQHGRIKRQKTIEIVLLVLTNTCLSISLCKKWLISQNVSP